LEQLPAAHALVVGGGVVFASFDTEHCELAGVEEVPDELEVSQ
jgi:hypothetical protein